MAKSKKAIKHVSLNLEDFEDCEELRKWINAQSSNSKSLVHAIRFMIHHFGYQDLLSYPVLARIHSPEMHSMMGSEYKLPKIEEHASISNTEPQKEIKSARSSISVEGKTHTTENSKPESDNKEPQQRKSRIPVRPDPKNL